MLSILLILGKGCQVKLFVALLLQCSWFFQDLVGVADNRLADGHPFQIALLLEQKLFFGRNLFQKLGKQLAIDTHPLSAMLSLLLAPFVEDQLPFSLRTSLDLEKRVGGTLQPLPLE